VEAHFAGTTLSLLGEVTDGERITISSQNSTLVDLPIDAALTAWKGMNKE
jgi:hypothetical protein